MQTTQGPTMRRSRSVTREAGARFPGRVTAWAAKVVHLPPQRHVPGVLAGGIDPVQEQQHGQVEFGVDLHTEGPVKPVWPKARPVKKRPADELPEGVSQPVARLALASWRRVKSSSVADSTMRAASGRGTLQGVAGVPSQGPAPLTRLSKSSVAGSL